MQYLDDLQAMQKFFISGATHSYTFRKNQLLALRAVILKYENEISEALFADLKKSPEEAYATEIGLLLLEIKTALSHLKRWMKPQKVISNLLNLPSTNKIYRDPFGVVLIIAPWNYPFQLLMIPLVGAIAGGNCAVVKPSELAPATSSIIKKIIGEAFQEQYIKPILGDGAKLVPDMMKAFRFDYVFYTGSTVVGKSIYQQAAADLIPVTLELGGKSPAIIEQDANLKVAARRIAMGKFTNAGQTCIAPDYVLVQQNVKEEFISLLKLSINQFYTEDPSGSYDFGKLINLRQFNRMISYLEQGKITYGGAHSIDKLFLGPTIMEDVLPESPLMSEEIFGPILPVISFDRREEAHHIVNQHPNPLAFYLFTNSSEAEEEWIARHSFGGGCINNAIWHFGNHHLPFGGVGSSGMGGYHGKYSFETFTRLKPVMKTPTWFDPSLKYPPFKGKMKIFKWVIG